MPLKSFAVYLFVFFLLSASAVGQVITGRVVDARTQEPLPAATITLVNTSLGSVSDHAGRFSINTKTAEARVVRISRVGYEAFEGLLPTGREPVEIALTPAFLALNKEIVVTAQRYETSSFGRPEAISVLTQQQLEQSAPRSTPEALLGVPGIWLQKTNHGGGSPFIRGLTGQQTLLMIDGIRLNNATFRSGPNQYLNTVDPGSIAQIEVMRGAGSVPYGSDALGGVAHILTKTPRFSDSLQLRGTAYGKYMSAGMEKSTRAELELSNSRLAVLGGVAYRDFGHVVAGGQLGTLKPTGYDQLAGDLKARFRLHDRYLLTAAWQQLSQHQVPVFHKVQLENFAFNHADQQQRQLAYVRLEGFHDNKWLRQLSLVGSRHLANEKRESRKNNAATVVTEHDQVATWGAQLVLHSQPASFWKVQSGVEFYSDLVQSSRQDLDAETGRQVSRRGLYPNGADAASLGVFMLNTLQHQHLTLSAGGRYQAFAITAPGDPAGSATIRPAALVGSFSALYALHPHHHLTLSANSAFRAPNIDDMGTLGIVDFRYEVPNAGLQPEKALNLEGGWKASSQHFSSQLVFFRSHLADLISRVRGRDSIQGYPVYLKQNVAQAYIQGFEAEAEWKLAPALAAYGSLVYAYGQNTTDQEPMRRIPPLNGRLGLQYQPARGFWLRPECLFAARQSRLAQGDIDDNRIADTGTPGWALFNLRAGYAWRWLQVSAEGHNLGHEAYRTHGSGVDGYGRSFWIATQVRF